MLNRIHGYITLGILITTLIISGIWYISSPDVSLAEKEVESSLQIHTGHYILIHLDKMTLLLRDGTTTIKTVTIISIGKRGSYYETIAGNYINDYKESLHFSSIGYVYMPFSTHIFGNFFIHGIPYYPDGTKVSTTFSGGCIRLSDENAGLVYNFVDKNTPIIITEGGEYDFSPTNTDTPTIESMDMTRLMVATISLEVLTQDNEILNTDGTITTRRKLLPQLILDKDNSVSTLYANSLGETIFIEYMNKKAKSIGLTNTIFTDVRTPVKTTGEDYLRFMKYIDTYKSYLRTDFIN